MSFDVTVMTSKGLQSQALSNILAQFSYAEYEPLDEDLTCEEVCSKGRRMASYLLRLFYSSRRCGKGYYCMLLMADVSLSFKLEFPCSKSEDEYEALIITLISVPQTKNSKTLCARRF